MPKQVFLDYSTGKVLLEEVPRPSLRPNGVIIRTLYSAISIGTEKLMLSLAKKSLLGKALERPDLLKLFIEYAKNEGFINAYRAAMARLKEPVPLGYSSSGMVLEVGQNASNEFKRGDLVACGGHGYASHAEITYVPRTLCVKIPEGVEPKYAAFANIGAIAIHGIRLARVELGSNIAIIGLGLLGLIAVQAAKAAGANVLGMDIVQTKIQLAKRLGADAVALVNRNDIDIIAQNFTENKGFDAVIVFASTKSASPIELAAKIARRKGRIVVPGWVKTYLPRNLFYEKELEFVIPRSSGLGIYDPLYETGKTQYLLEYVRWTAKENMRTFLQLLKEKKISMEPLVTHIFDFNKAEEVYEKLHKGKIKGAIGIIFKYPSTQNLETEIFSKQIVIEIKPVARSVEKKEKKKEKIRVGFIGAGQHAQGVLLPILKKMKNVEFVGVATTTPAKAIQIAKRWGFKYATTSPDKVIEDPDIDAIFVVTRHDTHAYYTVRALETGKYVFVEKPLAITLEQLEQVKKAIERHPGKLMVGFNRRWSKFSIEAKKVLAKSIEPKIILVRVNAGYTPLDSWIFDPAQGGGRIIGEICHFIDLSIYFTDSSITRFTLENASMNRYHITDNVSIILKHKDHSLTTIVYTSAGTRSYPRELVELYTSETAIKIDNFKYLIIKGSLGRKTIRKFNVDRGHKNMLHTFLSIVAEGSSIRQDILNQFLEASYITIKLNENIQKLQI